MNSNSGNISRKRPNPGEITSNGNLIQMFSEKQEIENQIILIEDLEGAINGSLNYNKK